MSKGLEALKELLKNHPYHEEDCDRVVIIEKELKALNEILVLYDKWLGNEMSDFEFFTLLNEIINKNDLLKEVKL